MAKTLNVLHLAGSNEDTYWLNVSMMYAKAALTFPCVKAFYAVVNPNNVGAVGQGTQFQNLSLLAKCEAPTRLHGVFQNWPAYDIRI